MVSSYVLSVLFLMASAIVGWIKFERPVDPGPMLFLIFFFLAASVVFFLWGNWERKNAKELKEKNEARAKRMEIFTGFCRQIDVEMVKIKELFRESVRGKKEDGSFVIGDMPISPGQLLAVALQLLFSIQNLSTIAYGIFSYYDPTKEDQEWLAEAIQADVTILLRMKSLATVPPCPPEIQQFLENYLDDLGDAPDLSDFEKWLLEK